MSSSKRGFDRAVVIGGSIAGLLSARVLAEHFQQVLILERDSLPEGPEPRKGVPQGRHVHALLEAGLKVLDTLFPRLMEEMAVDGVERIDMGQQTAWFHCGTWKPRYRSGYETILCTRPYLEWKVRGRVVTLPNVELRTGYAVEELLSDATRTRVTGVKVKGPHGEETLEADLVVDASGRGSRASHWLEVLGFGRPPEEQVGVDIGYTTRLYERPSTMPSDWKTLAVYARPPGAWHSGFACNVEGGHWIVSLSGYFGDHPPTDEEGFLEFARSLPTPHLHEALRQARPLTPLTAHKILSSRWLHFERMARFPEGLVLLGDSVCALNPVYGQGMTVIALGAKLLGECVADQARTSGTLQGLSRRFQEKLAATLGLSWFLSTTMDLSYPQTRGKRPPGLKLLQWFVGNLLDLTSVDQETCHEFYRVLHLRGGMEVLLQPKVALALLSYSIKSLFVPLERRANVANPPHTPESLASGGRVRPAA